MIVEFELFHPSQKLGSMELDMLPEPGELLELDGKQYRVRSRIFQLRTQSLTTRRVFITLMPWSFE